VVRSLKELERYPWSGHRVLIGGDKNGWQQREYVLQQFSENRRRAILAYRRFMEEGKDQGRRPDLVGGELIRSRGGWSRVLSARGKRERVEHDARILGGGDFLAEILREANKKLRRQLRSGEREASMERVIRKMCMEAGVEEQEVRNGGQRRKVSKVRSQIAYYLSHELGISMAEIARNLGVCSSAIIKAVQKLESQNGK
jgi:DNA-binding Lrp family transcriptional regulator